MSDNSALLQQAARVAQALGGEAEVILVDGGFVVRSHNAELAHDSAETETVQAPPQQTSVQQSVQTSVQQSVQEPPQETHYAPQFIQSPQQNNQFALWQMVQPMFQQNPLMALAMMQMMQAQQSQQFPQAPVAQFPQFPHAHVAQYSQAMPTYVQQPPVQMQSAPAYVQTVQESTPVEEVKKSAKSIRKEKKAAQAAEADTQVAVQAAPAAQTSEVPTKGRWADIANSGAPPKPVRQNILPPAAGIPVKKGTKATRKDNSRVNKDSVDRVDLSAVASYKPKPGFVTGPNLLRNRPTNPEIPICTITHSIEECEGDCDWIQCVGVDGEPINGATSPFSNKAAHCNAVSSDAPTTADFCKNQVNGAPACDIHGCVVMNCPANHVGKFETRKDVLDQVKSSMRRPRVQRDNTQHDYKPRSRAVGANGERPEELTVGDFRIMVEAGVTLDIDDSPLNMSTGSANNIPVGEVVTEDSQTTSADRTISTPASRPVIMKKSIEGVPAKITGKGKDSGKGSDAGKDSGKGKEDSKDESK